ncbi:MAG: urea amidolyase associated protein UAAP1 [Vibrio sp.]
MSTEQTYYSDVIPGAAHWSMIVKKGQVLRVQDQQGGANVSMLFYNPINLLERYNAPDTLKCQHTFKITKGHCLYSDMGHIFCSVVRDDTGWIDTVCGVANKAKVTEKWGARDYQADRNNWKQNGYDALLVEVAKYGLGKRDLAANLNLFSAVKTDSEGCMHFVESHSKAGDCIELRFEMDTLVVLTTCPHPMNPAKDYPFKPVEISVMKAEPVTADDACIQSCAENGRGLQNNQRLYPEHHQAHAHCCHSHAE